MIDLTRLSGSTFVLNCDLIERVDQTPDTVITLGDGTKYVVAESLGVVVAKVRRHRAEVIALSEAVHADPSLVSTPVPPPSRSVPSLHLAVTRGLDVEGGRD